MMHTAQVLLQNMRGRALSRSNDLGLMQGLPPGTAYTASPVLESAYLEVRARPANLPKYHDARASHSEVVSQLAATVCC